MTSGRFVPVCQRCGRPDLTVAETRVKDGPPWRPMCADCCTKVRRLRAVEKVEAAA